MRRIFAGTGTFAAGTVAWSIGHRVGLGAAVILSAIASGFGFYWGRRLFDEWLG